MTIEEAETRIEALEEKLDALGDVVNVLVDIIGDNLQHSRIHEARVDLSNYELLP